VSGPPPAQAAATPGQAAYEAAPELDDSPVPGWGNFGPDRRAAWEAAAQAVLNGAFPGLKRELAEARAKLAKALAANQRWAETLGDVQQRHTEVKRERDDARAHRERLNRELATSAREHNSLTAQLATCRERNAAIAAQLDQYRDERDEAHEEAALPPDRPEGGVMGTAP